ncbi:hypothetical protein ACFFSW_03685 [Saccharothrix longispora]|uniref:YHS domain-containing protein n=1 Tax=Saccharothrix longispora TaxID=33920 RepID=A0ABU1PNB6_9PSEU|nr:hypothetical protein [Saccharothrix longispora]MDR6592163.1 hypothetical protein [Saccharothrix longispora]
MVWFFTQTFVLCTAAFVAGAALTWLPLRAVIRDLRAQVRSAVVRPVRAALPPAPTGERVEESVVLPEPGARRAEDEPVDERDRATGQCEVKGSPKSMIFHTAESPYFKRMKGDVVFRSAAEAERAGYTRWAPKTPRTSRTPDAAKNPTNAESAKTSGVQRAPGTRRTPGASRTRTPAREEIRASAG